MSTQQDISNEMRSATRGAACRTESGNHPAHDRACDYADLVHHHNERAKARQKQPEPAAEQVPDTPEPDYDAEGMAPHN